MQGFEWDEEKNRLNIEKHGVNFELAISIFDGPIVEDVDDRFGYREVRMIAVGSIGDHVLTVVYTMRGETCRIISARRANRDERNTYNKTRARKESG